MLLNDRFQTKICIFKHGVSVIHMMLLHEYDLVEYWEVFKDKQLKPFSLWNNNPTKHLKCYNPHNEKWLTEGQLAALQCSW